MKSLMCSLLALVAILCSRTVIAQSPLVDDDLLRPIVLPETDQFGYLDDYLWRWYLKEFPERATLLDLRLDITDLDDMSPATLSQRYEKVQEMLQATHELSTVSYDYIRDGSPLPQSTRRLRYKLQSFLDGYQYQGFLTPVNNLANVHDQLLNVLRRMPNNNTSDMERITIRMGNIPAKIDQIVALLANGSDLNITNHNLSMDRLEVMLSRFIIDKAQESPYYEMFEDDVLPDDANRKQIQKKAKKKIKEISKASERLRDFLASQYQTRPLLAVTSLADGPARYKACISFFANTNMEPATAHSIGLQQVNTTLGQIQDVMNELGFGNMTIKEFFNFLDTNETMYFSSSDELVQAYQQIISDQILPKLDTLFEDIPKMILRVQANELTTRNDYYIRETADDAQVGVLVLGTVDLKMWPKYSLVSSVLNAAYPGRHMITAKIRADTELPLYRRYVDSTTGSNLASAPSDFTAYNGFIDGWSAYSELLGFDIDLYDDPWNKLGHYYRDLVSSYRLVVDTGIHAYGWSQQMAIEYFLQDISLPQTFVEAEVNRYITFPGEATASKLGQNKLKTLRKEVLGDDSKKHPLFHGQIMADPTDLDSIKRPYIAGSKSGAPCQISKLTPTLVIWVFLTIYSYYN